MEADWEFEIGGDAPVIEAYWPGFVNVRDDSARVREIAETKMLPGLAAALVQLNQVGSPVWTCKADVFIPDQIDRDELSADPDETRFAIACYIDTLMRSDRVWSDLSKAERDCRSFCSRVREIPLRCCRMDVVVRRAVVGKLNDLGATVYLTACGRTLAHARERLTECLGTVVPLMLIER